METCDSNIFTVQNFYDIKIGRSIQKKKYSEEMSSLSFSEFNVKDKESKDQTLYSAM